MLKTVKGAKGGSKNQRQPKVANDTTASKTYARLQYGMSEGEVEGLANGFKSIFLDDTPVENDSGARNFQDVTLDFRSGTNDQAYMEGFESIASETAVGVELKSDTPWVKGITNLNLDAVIVRVRFGALKQQDPSNGDVSGIVIDYLIEVQTDGGSWELMLDTQMSGKTSANYERTHRIGLPKANNSWLIRVTRKTPNSSSEYVSDKMYIQAITEVVDLKLAYPNTALIGVQYDAETFSNIAKIAVDLKGVKIKVPNNYDPISRTYIGIWDGLFKRAYSNNPAWIYYDLCTNKRYALGNRLTEQMIDKWSLYRLAQYCDQLVPNGKGGQEPRFTCNVYIQSAESAFDILSKLAGLFRAISYWDGNSIVCEADLPQDTMFTYTSANIIDGAQGINYSGTRARDRHNAVKVAWDNPQNRYKTEYVFVRDEKSIAEAKAVRLLELEAWGCTSEGQAQRTGQWALKTEQLETRTVTFKVGLDGYIPLPGKVIELADELLAGRANGGRISSVSTDLKQITLDRDDVVCRAGDRLVVNGENGKAQARVVSSIAGRVVTVVSAFDSVAPQNVWVIDAQDLATMKFRVVSISQDEPHQFTITALQHADSKFDAIDHGAFIDDRPISIINPTTQAPVESVTISSEQMVQQGMSVETMVISWPQAKDATKYQVEWRKDNGTWLKLPLTGSNSAEVAGIYAGQYEARVFAISAFDISSLPTYSVLTELKGKQGKPPKLANIHAEGILFGMKLTWLFPAVGALDTAYAEIEVSPDSTSNIAQLGLFAYPTTVHTIQGMQPNLRQYYRGRLIDRIGNVGDWSDWVSGVTSADASDVLELLNEQITESQLHKDLQTKIDHIENIDTEIGPIRQDIQNTKDQISQEIIDRQHAIQNAEDGLSQKINDSEEGILEVIDTVKKSSDQGIAAAQTTIKVVADDLKLTAEKTDGVYAQLNPPLIGSSTDLIGSDQGFAGTWSVQSAMIEGDLALSKRVDTTVAQINDVQAFAQQEVVARVEGQKATVDKIDTYIAENDTALASVRNSAKIAVDTSKANGELIQSMELELDDKASTGQLTQVKSEIEEDYNDKITAQTTKIDGVYAQINPPLIGSESDLIGNSGGYAGVWSEQSARIEGDLSQSIRTDQVVAQMNQNDALYQQQIKATADAVSANVSATTTLQTKVGENTASIQTQQSSINGINLQYTLKLQSGNLISGIGMMNDGKTSDIIFNSSSVAFGSDNSGVVTYPVVFRNTAFTDPVNGTVFPVGAYIKSGFFDYQSVKTSHIEDLAVKTAKIEDLAVTAGKIKDLAVGTLKIQDEAVTVPTSIKSTSEIVVSGAYSPQYSDYDSQLAEWEAKFGNLLTATINRSGGKCRIDASCIAFRSEYLTAYAVDGRSLSYFERLNLRAVVSIYRNGTLVARQETPPTDVMSSGGFYFTGTFAVNAGIEDIFSGLATYVLKLGFANRNTRAIRITLNSTTGIFSIQSPQMILTEMKK